MQLMRAPKDLALLTAAVPAVLLVAIGLACTGCARRKPDHPNILLVTLDTTRADRLGAYGHARARTPVFDRLASEGLLFTRAWTVTPLTTPAHASLMAGIYPGSHRVRTNGRFALPDEATTLAETLKAAGYRCGAFVGGFPVSRIFGLGQGFDVFDDDFGVAHGAQRSERRADEVNARALPWLRAELGRRDRAPFFAWIHYYDPHEPYQPPAPYAQQFQGNFYDGEIAFMDSELGRVIDVLREADALDETIVAVLSDHGEGLGDHGEPTHGIFLYEAMVRIPMVLRAPWAVPQGARSDVPATIVDVYPTLLDLAKLERPGTLQGIELTASSQGPSSDSLLEERGPSRVLFAETYYANEEFLWAPLFAVRRGERKWIAAPTPERFDLAPDPRESRNLAGSDPAIDHEMQKLLAGAVVGSERSRLSQDSEMEVDEDVLARLQSLGYIGGGGAGPGSATSAAGATPAAGRDPKEGIEDYNAYLRATALVDRGQGPPAVEILEKLASGDPANPMFRLRLGLAYQAARDPSKAETTFRELIAEQPLFYLAYRRLSALLEGRGRAPESRDLWLKLRGLGGEFVGLDARLARAYLGAGQPKEALELCDGYLAKAKNENDTEMLAYSGQALEALGRSDQALDRYRRALELSPADARALRPAVALLSKRGEVDEARALVEDSLKRGAAGDPGILSIARSIGLDPSKVK